MISIELMAHLGQIGAPALKHYPMLTQIRASIMGVTTSDFIQPFRLQPTNGHSSR